MYLFACRPVATDAYKTDTDVKSVNSTLSSFLLGSVGLLEPRNHFKQLKAYKLSCSDVSNISNLPQSIEHSLLGVLVSSQLALFPKRDEI